MRLIRFEAEDGNVYLGQEVSETQAELLTGQLFHNLESSGQKMTIRRRLAPLDPVNIFCIGLNYREHAVETGAPIPENPVVFMKPTSALNHPDSDIVLPACSRGPETDYEAELAVVIGRAARNVSEAEALNYVYGYTSANDVSARRCLRPGNPRKD